MKAASLKYGWRARLRGWERPVAAVVMIFLLTMSFFMGSRALASHLLAGLLAFLYFFTRERIGILRDALLDRYVSNVLAMLALLALGVVLAGWLHGTYDFRFSLTILNAMVAVGCLVCVYAWLRVGLRASNDEIVLWWGYAFALQGVICLIGFASPAFRQVVYSMNGYSAVFSYFRYLPLSGGVIWGLSGASAIVAICLAHYAARRGLTWKIVLTVLLLSVGGFCGGRFYLPGLGVAILLYIVEARGRVRWIVAGSIAGVLLLWLAVVLFVDRETLLEHGGVVMAWVLQPIRVLEGDTGGSYSSVLMLAQHWDVGMSDAVALLGNGHWENPDGSHYLNLDPGPLRQGYFWGLAGYLCTVALLCYVSWPLLKRRSSRLFGAVLLLWVILCDFKGVVMSKMFVTSLMFAALIFGDVLKLRRPRCGEVK